MTTSQDIAAATESLKEIWENPPQRRNCFGNALRSMSIRGIRGLDAQIELDWPVVAIAGTNGSGKTTILQIASAAYTTVASGARHYTLGRWIGPAMERLGESPNIAADARIIYQYYDDTPTVEVAYQPHRTRWGYPRRGNPSRFVQFIGIGNYAPRIEKIDRTHLARGRLEVRETRRIPNRTLESFSRILGRSYDAAVIATVSVPAAEWTDDVPFLQRGDVGYAWPNMGAGEQKLLRLIDVLEELPHQSLILLEEPELTLHGDAQQGFAWYLMTLARRNGHQIVVATHSSHIFETLPPEGRILISRVRGEATVLHRAPKFSAARKMAAGAIGASEIIFVEDQVAERFLTELVRRYMPDLRHTAQIVPLGSSDDVRRAVASLRAKGVRAVGVRRQSDRSGKLACEQGRVDQRLRRHLGQVNEPGLRMFAANGAVVGPAIGNVHARAHRLRARVGRFRQQQYVVEQHDRQMWRHVRRPAIAVVELSRRGQIVEICND